MPLQYAALPKRGAAFVIDLIPAAPLLPFITTHPALLPLAAALAGAALEASPWQASLGKRLLRIRCMEAEGRRLTPPRALARNALRFLPFGLLAYDGSIPAVLLIATVLGIAFHPRCRPWHDLLAGTSVIDPPRP